MTALWKSRRCNIGSKTSNKFTSSLKTNSGHLMRALVSSNALTKLLRWPSEISKQGTLICKLRLLQKYLSTSLVIFTKPNKLSSTCLCKESTNSSEVAFRSMSITKNLATAKSHLLSLKLITQSLMFPKRTPRDFLSCPLRTISQRSLNLNATPTIKLLKSLLMLWTGKLTSTLSNLASKLWWSQLSRTIKLQWSSLKT